MFPLLRKNLFSLTSRSSFSSSSSSSQHRRLLIPFPLRDFSSCSSSSCTQPHCERVEKENIRVSVWWNFNDCRVPPGVSVMKVVPLIIEAVRVNGIEGPINNIVAYGDVTQFPKLERKALSAAGVHLRHYNGGKDMINRHLTFHLEMWCIENPPPVHIFLISSDERSLHPLRMKNYNMLVAYPERASPVMCSATTIMWSWCSILKRENLIGKYFNYPPDGPLNSWYGDLKAPIENPDSAAGESTSSQNACPVPSNVSYLKVPASIMGAARTNGFKGPIYIEAYGNVYQLSDINQETLFLNGVDLHHFPGKENGSHKYLKDWISMNPPPAHLFLITGNRDPDFVCTVRELSLNNYKILYACPGRADDYPCSESTTRTLEWSSIVKGKYLIGSAETYNNSSTFFSWINSWWPFSKSSTKSDDLTANQDVIHSDDLSANQDVTHSRKPELFEDSTLAEVDKSVSHFEKPESSKLQQDVSHSRISELFCTGSFWWDVVESFLFTPQGLSLLSESRSREDLARKLQKHGHPFFRCLSENDILLMVEVLIADTKWLEESPSQAFPFRLTHKQCSSPNPTILDPNPVPDYL